MASKAAASIGPLKWKLEQLPALTVRAACRGITLTSENGDPYRDEIGEDLSDDQAAWRSALRLSRDIEERLAPGGTWRLQVRPAASSALQIEIRSEWVEANSVPDNVTRNK